MFKHNTFQHPLQGRYPSETMKGLWSDDVKFQTWRMIWIALAEAEQFCGLDITDEQIDEMRRNRLIIDYDYAQAAEKRRRHDVMAHVETFGVAAPSAAGIIHLGATSCCVTDNADIWIIRRALELVCKRLARCIDRMATFAKKYRDLPTLGFTHFQPAQLVTVGKRACMWLQDLVLDLDNIETVKDNLQYRGLKGATGTQASYLALFQGDGETVKSLEDEFLRLLEPDMNFIPVFHICGQTYTRKQDLRVVSALCELAASIHKISLDIRMLAHDKEIEEPFEAEQDGSSAMPYKRNPMLDERNDALMRYAGNQYGTAWQTHATQILERSLDDSAARRMFLPEIFLTIDAGLIILQRVFEGIIVYPKMIEQHVQAELPFMATEEILMAMVESGASRQETHTRIKKLAQAAGDRVKKEGLPNTLLDEIRKDSYFAAIHHRLDDLTDARRFIGRCPEMVNSFLKDEVAEILKDYHNDLTDTAELSV